MKRLRGAHRHAGRQAGGHRLCVRRGTRSRLPSLASTVALSCLAALAAAAPAQATTPVKCEQAPLQTAINKATAGEVLQVAAGTCDVNLTVENNEPFTLEGTAPGTTLEPTVTTKPIVDGKKPTSGLLSFTLSDLTFTGTTKASAVEFETTVEAVTISTDTFIANATNQGGGALFFQGGEVPTTTPTVISGNHFGEVGAGNRGEYGGAINWVSGDSLDLIGNVFEANKATQALDGAGGAVAIANFSGGANPIDISGNTFGGTAAGAGNTSAYSGGGAFVELLTGQPLTLDGNRFIDNAITGTNTATSPRTGGGLTITIENGTEGFPASQADNVFAGNLIDETDESKTSHEPAGGAGEWVFGTTVQSIADRFEANSITVADGEPEHPPEGGGLGVLGEAATSVPAQPGVFIGADDLFAKNSVAAGGWGGAIYAGFKYPVCTSGCPGSSVALQDSTVLDNTVEAGEGSQGAALWGGSHDNLTIDDSIVYGNTPQPQIFGFGGSTAFAYSDVCSESGGPTVSGAGVICANPLLEVDGEEALASPTIDAGSNALVAVGLSTDLAGLPRIAATRLSCSGVGPATVDMGAFEYQHVGPLPPCPILSEALTTPTPPILANASQSSRRWREGTRLASFSRKHRLPPLGTTFSFTLNEPARVSFAFTQRVGGRKVNGKCVAQTKKNHHKRACKRTVTQGVLSFAGHSGANKVSFQGRISHSKKLRPGTYTLVITATNTAGQHSAPKPLSFTILR